MRTIAIKVNKCKCGGKAAILSDPGVGYEVHCLNRKCTFMVGMFDYPDEAADAWNRGDQYLEEEVEGE